MSELDVFDRMNAALIARGVSHFVQNGDLTEQSALELPVVDNEGKQFTLRITVEACK